MIDVQRVNVYVGGHHHCRGQTTANTRQNTTRAVLVALCVSEVSLTLQILFFENHFQIF